MATSYVEELGRLQGRSRELVEAKLRTETDRLTAAEQRLGQAENDRIHVEVADAEREWVVRALRDFDRVWSLMTPENRRAPGEVAGRRDSSRRGEQPGRGRVGELRRRSPGVGGRMTDTKESAEETLQDRLVLKGTLFRRQGRRVELTDRSPMPPEPRAPVRRPAKVARMLALAHHLQRLIDQGLVSDRAALAGKLGLTRARVTQLLDLLLLAPAIQEAVLTLEAVDGVEPICERNLRSVVGARDWAAQAPRWRNVTRAAIPV